jgi:CheY-like chemotaxis protein
MVLKRSFLNAHAMAGAAIGALGYLAEKKGVSISNEIDPRKRIYADQALFSEVLKNLLSNSIKFCNRGDKITFMSPADRPTSIAVSDTGIGIKSALLPDIFKYEVKTSTPGTEHEFGSGLGLPYSHDIIAAHGGALTVESKEGRGATFYVEIPSVRPTVLIVDDEPDHRLLLVTYLSKLEVNVKEAGDGEEALKMIMENAPHLIIADIAMPRKDGFQLLSDVRKTRSISSTPFIIISGMGDIESNQTSVRLGADDFMAKPISMGEFIPRVRKFIG